MKSKAWPAPPPWRPPVTAAAAQTGQGDTHSKCTPHAAGQPRLLPRGRSSSVTWLAGPPCPPAPGRVPLCVRNPCRGQTGCPGSLVKQRRPERHQHQAFQLHRTNLRSRTSTEGHSPTGITDVRKLNITRSQAAAPSSKPVKGHRLHFHVLDASQKGLQREDGSEGRMYSPRVRVTLGPL